ncbi:MAG: DEAD/DEAH box helicase [Lachnospiraceae bacterium]|nr:DEAD/DEAH box helicase [Lachnospiraceae bacterium]
MEKLNFKDAKRLLLTLSDLDLAFQEMFLSRESQEIKIKSIYNDLALDSARESLSEIPVEELKRSKAGIRVSALEEAGYTDLLKLSKASDWELLSIEGIGEKQVESIRNIIAEFLTRLTPYSVVRLSVLEGGQQTDSKNNRLIQALASYRQCELIRADAAPLSSELHGTVEHFLSIGIITGRLKWIFSSRAEKARTVSVINEILDFLNSRFYERVRNLLSMYREAAEITIPEALKDFSGNAADHYVILEKISGRTAEKPLIYSSIPAQLAAQIDEYPLDLGLFQGNLREYQAFGTKYILHQKRVLLGDEMGLGKTVQAIAAMTHIHSEDRQSFFLVVCPASVLVNWCREIKKFSSIQVFLVHGHNMEEAFSSWQQTGGAAVTNYESMGKIIDRIDNHMKLSLLVIDEAHYIKNPEAQRTRYIHMLENEAERIVMMTGTPLENRVDEMCSLIDFVRPDMSVKVRGAAQISRAPQFKEILAPVYLRRLRDQVLSELPPIEEEQEWCLMTAADTNAYILALREKNFTKLRRVSFLQDDLKESSKAVRLLEICREANEEGRKILIYSFFRDTIDKVRALLGNVCVGEITGDTEIGARQLLIDRFNDSQDGSVLLCQIQAGGTGLNIQSASIVIFCEPQIKPSLTAQAISRVYRMGQVRNVLVYHLLCEDTVDEAMLDRLSEKQMEFDAFADESSMAEATENLADKEWIRKFLDAESNKYALAVI